jgi:hypothetical protein
LFSRACSIFQQAVIFLIANGILSEFKPRLKAIHEETLFLNEFFNEADNAVLERHGITSIFI